MKKRGFTIMELLAVIVVLGLLMVIAVPMIMSAKEGALNSLSKLQERNLKDAGRQLALELDDPLSSIYNCKSTSWVATEENVICRADTETKRWVHIEIPVAKLIEHNYFQDEGKHCEGVVFVKRDGSSYAVDMNTATCSK